VKLASAATQWGLRAGENGFFTRDLATGQQTFNAAASRGRIYDKVDQFPSWVVGICNEALQQAVQKDPYMPLMQCTHLLLNYYASSQGLEWHRDIYENDGTGNHPIVNLSLGSSATFSYKHLDEDAEKSVILRSGDALIFGGPCRYIKHCVQDIKLQELPENWPLKPGRFSFTFRDSPEAIGREDEFKYFKPDEHLISQGEWENAYTMGHILPLIKAQESQCLKAC
jgi:hypothetical protein